MKKKLTGRYSRRSSAEWLKIIDAQSKSGISEKRFCSERGLSLTSFRNWRRKLKKRTSSKFVTFDIAPDSSSREWEAAFELPGGVIVRIAGSLATSRIKELLSAAKEA